MKRRLFGDLPDVLDPTMQTPSPPNRKVARSDPAQVISSGPHNQFPQIVGTTVIRALPNNERRNYLLIQNNGTSPVYVGVGRAPQASGLFLTLAANGGAWEPSNIPTSSISLVSAVAGQSVCVIEGVSP